MSEMSLSDLHTCVTCKVYFKSNEIQREHYKSDWHRYNLKRKIANLPSVTAEEFNNRVLQQRNLVEKSHESTTKYCETCKKSFGNEKSYENHLNSKKHIDNLVNVDKNVKKNVEKPVKKVEEIVDEDDDDMSTSDIEEVDSDEWDDEIPVTECLFCNNHSRSLVRNLRHMTEKHSFFIPDIEFCVDIEGLIGYLGAKIRQGHMCLWCSEKGKNFLTTESVQSHMIDKGHCKMLFEGAALVEYTDFYDYTTSYPENAENSDENSIDPDEEVSLPEIDGSDFNLVLPSGAVIGHRSLFRYYKQRFSTSTVVSIVETKSKPEKICKILAHYRNTGWEVAQPDQIKKRARDIQYVQKLQKKWEMKLSLKANKMQKHFRQQVNY